MKLETTYNFFWSYDEKRENRTLGNKSNDGPNT